MQDYHSYSKSNDCNNNCCQKNHHHCHCSHCMRGACSTRFKLRLGGLANGMQFRLQQLIGCKVKLCVECGEQEEHVIGIIKHVGQDYVEVKVLKKWKAEDIEAEETIMKELKIEAAEEQNEERSEVEKEFAKIDDYFGDSNCRRKSSTLYLSSSIKWVEIH